MYRVLHQKSGIPIKSSKRSWLQNRLLKTQNTWDIIKGYFLAQRKFHWLAWAPDSIQARLQTGGKMFV